MEIHDVFFLIFAATCGLMCSSYVCYSCYKCFFSRNDNFSSSYSEIVDGGNSWPGSFKSYHIRRALGNKRHWDCRPTKMPLVNDCGFPIRPHQYPGNRIGRSLQPKNLCHKKIVDIHNYKLESEKESLLSESRCNDSYGTMECSSSTTNHLYDSISSSGTYSSSSGAYSQSTSCLADESSNSISTVDSTYYLEGVTIPPPTERNIKALIKVGKRYYSNESYSTNEE